MQMSLICSGFGIYAQKHYGVLLDRRPDWPRFVISQSIICRVMAEATCASSKDHGVRHHNESVVIGPTSGFTTVIDKYYLVRSRVNHILIRQCKDKDKVVQHPSSKAESLNHVIITVSQTTEIDVYTHSISSNYLNSYDLHPTCDFQSRPSTV